MFKDFFQSFKDDLSKRTTNPFLGTYLLVILFRNWRLIFVLFNFDDSHSLDEKLKIIDEYFNSISIFWYLAENVLYTFTVLIVTYILLNIARLITNFFEKIVTPRIIEFSDSRGIVEKKLYDEAIDKIDNLKKNNEEKAMKIESLESKLEKIQTNLNDSEQKLIRKEREFLTGKLILTDLKYTFLRFSRDIRNGDPLSISDADDSRNVTELIKIGVIYENKDPNLDLDSYSGFHLTTDGEEILQRILELSDDGEIKKIKSEILDESNNDESNDN
jgi:hypothetical protein